MFREMKDPSWMPRRQGCASSSVMVKVNLVIGYMTLLRFMEDQVIEVIDKIEKTIPKKDSYLLNIDPVQLLVHNLDNVGGNVHNDEPRDYVDDQLLGDEIDALDAKLLELAKVKRKF